MFGRLANHSMVLGWYEDDTRAVPGYRQGGTSHSQYCECLYNLVARLPVAISKPKARGGQYELSFDTLRGLLSDLLRINGKGCT